MRCLFACGGGCLHVAGWPGMRSGMLPTAIRYQPAQTHTGSAASTTAGPPSLPICSHHRGPILAQHWLDRIETPQSPISSANGLLPHHMIEPSPAVWFSDVVKKRCCSLDAQSAHPPQAPTAKQTRGANYRGTRFLLTHALVEACLLCLLDAQTRQIHRSIIWACAGSWRRSLEDTLMRSAISLSIPRSDDLLRAIP
jgi:hypothetical protein